MKPIRKDSTRIISAIIWTVAAFFIITGVCEYRISEPTKIQKDFWTAKTFRVFTDVNEWQSSLPLGTDRVEVEFYKFKRIVTKGEDHVLLLPDQTLHAVVLEGIILISYVSNIENEHDEIYRATNPTYNKEVKYLGEKRMELTLERSWVQLILYSTLISLTLGSILSFLSLLWRLGMRIKNNRQERRRARTA